MLEWRSRQTRQSVKLEPQGYVGANPTSSTNALVAQSVERILGKNEVSGSIPDEGSKFKKRDYFPKKDFIP